MFEVHSCVYLTIGRKLLSSNMRVQNILSVAVVPLHDGQRWRFDSAVVHVMVKSRAATGEVSRCPRKLVWQAEPTALEIPFTQFH